MEITVTRHAVDGFTLSTIEGGQLLSKRFIGYTLRDAKRQFKQEVKEGKLWMQL